MADVQELRENPQTPLSLSELDDWIQNYLSKSSDSRVHLRAPADSGSTRRIRRIAGARLGQLDAEGLPC